MNQEMIKEKKDPFLSKKLTFQFHGDEFVPLVYHLPVTQNNGPKN